MEFKDCNEDTSKILYNKLREEYENKNKDNKKEINKQAPAFQNFLFNLYEEGS
jgi:hypothetical protein